MTGMDTAAMISRIIPGSDCACEPSLELLLTIRATPPSRRMLAGIRSTSTISFPAVRDLYLGPTQGHDGTGACLLGDLGLLDVHNVHDDTKAISSSQRLRERWRTPP